jgi:hypothetical protein
MFERVLSSTIQKNLARIAETALVKQFYLAGGTAVALHLGHRQSYDLDFFTQEWGFATDLLRQELAPLGELTVLHQEGKTFIATLNGAQISFFIYPYPLLETLAVFAGIRLASLSDLAAMKLDTISSRGAKRDFVDLYQICQDAFSLREAIRHFERKYTGVKYSLIHLLKSLEYFEDAEPDPMPPMLVPLEWGEVKRFFEDEVRRLMRELL